MQRSELGVQDGCLLQRVGLSSRSRRFHSLIVDYTLSGPTGTHFASSMAQPGAPIQLGMRQHSREALFVPRAPESGISCVACGESVFPAGMAPRDRPNGTNFRILPTDLRI